MNLLQTIDEERGQMLLIAVLVACVLILVSIPAVIYINHMSTRTVVSTQEREKASMAIQEALAYASQVFLSSTTWNAVLSGRCPAEFQDANGTSLALGSTAGNTYTIGCTKPADNAPGQAHLVITAYGSNRARGPLRTVLAVLALRTAGSQGKSMMALGKPAALQLLHVPEVGGELRVHWGPMLCYDATPWKLIGEMDTLHYPRVFSQGPIYRATSKTSGEGTDLFANTSLGFAPVIDERTYKRAAELSMNVSAPASADPMSGQRLIEANPPGSGYFYIETDTAVFRSIGHDYRSPGPSTVLYIDGNAEFQDVFLDLSKGGALIVKGNLTLHSRKTQGGEFVSLPVPSRAADEYPEEPMTNHYPCRLNIGRTCLEPLLTHIRGFVYVKGDLFLGAPGFQDTSNWVLSGALRVDGRLVIPDDATLTLYYDESTGSQIQVTGSRVEVISMQEADKTSFP